MKVIAAVCWIAWTMWLVLPILQRRVKVARKEGGGAYLAAYSICNQAAVYWVERGRLVQRVSQYVPQLERYCSMVYGRRGASNPTVMWLAKVLLSEWLLFHVLMFVWIVFSDATLALTTLPLLPMTALMMWRELYGSVRRRQSLIVAELPNFVYKISLFITAGETVQGAWIRASAAPVIKETHPLYMELSWTRTELEQSVPFIRALEQLNRRCSVPEMSLLITTVLMNYRRGGDAFVIVLQQTARTLMERKGNVIRTVGEEASTKVIFPMMLMFVAVMIIVAAPSVMLMNQP